MLGVGSNVTMFLHVLFCKHFSISTQWIFFCTPLISINTFVNETALIYFSLIIEKFMSISYHNILNIKYQINLKKKKCQK